MTKQAQTYIGERRVHIMEGDIDMSALLPQRELFFKNYFAETLPLDKEHKVPGDYFRAFYDEKIESTGTHMVVTHRRSRETRAEGTKPAEASSVLGVAEKASTERMELLARKYVAKSDASTEDIARLAIVTERLRQLVPAVNTGDLETLAAMLEAVKVIESADHETRERIGIAR